jgi:hypothetical protein
MMEGFFRIAYTGTAGSGFGMLVLSAGNIAGADMAGATYDGTYAELPESHALDFKVKMLAPAGITPVQTGIPLPADTTLSINAILPHADIVAERPILMQTSLGPVNVVFSKVRDLT